ncbi:flagellar basal body rod protein FlgB [Occallatibacter savannae]|uniref:flagellar basal body rod protein FlgB n=1 Tax=Occallatibacter savannae TaxID=1002691 RepID=UPI000D68850F|nr:flagellar basal body rod protein FlgB [Occallatibacter savannae]
MRIETKLGEQLSRYLDLSASEAKVSAFNMANVDTPGFRARGFDFEAEIAKAFETIENGRSHPPRVHDVEGLISRPDGNNVSVDRESMKLAVAQLKFRTGISLLRLENQRMMDAIHADR